MEKKKKKLEGGSKDQVQCLSGAISSLQVGKSTLGPERQSCPKTPRGILKTRVCTRVRPSDPSHVHTQRGGPQDSDLSGQGLGKPSQHRTTAASAR